MWGRQRPKKGYTPFVSGLKDGCACLQFEQRKPSQGTWLQYEQRSNSRPLVIGHVLAQVPTGCTFYRGDYHRHGPCTDVGAFSAQLFFCNPPTSSTCRFHTDPSTLLPLFCWCILTLTLVCRLVFPSSANASGRTSSPTSRFLCRLFWQLPLLT